MTGARGLLGSAICAHLKRQGYLEVITIGREECDLTDPQATLHLFERLRPDYVFHAAARVYGLGGNLRNKAASFYDNVMINTNVVHSSHRVGTRKITVMGTGAVYPYPAPGQPFTEDMIFMGEPHHSEDSYSHAKRAMLGMLRAYAESYGMQWAYVVCCNLYGPGDKFDPELSHVIPSLVRKFYEAKQANGIVTVWGDGSARRDFLYVTDAARLAVRIMEQVDGAVNIGSGRVHTIREVVEALARVSGMEGRYVWDASRPNGREYLGYDLSRIGSLGFSCQYSLEDGLRETWAWYEALRAGERQ